MRTPVWMVPVIMLALVGCGERKKPLTFHPTSGTVFYEGQPAAGVKVYLLPTSAPMVPEIPTNPHGVTGADGKFSIGTFSAADGAAEGGYQVILLWPPEGSRSEEAADSDRFFGWYDASHSMLSAQIKPGTNVIPPIQVPTLKGPPPPSQGIPGRN